MFIKPRPIGTNPPDDEDRQAIWRVTSGDMLQLTTRVTLVTGDPVTPENSKLRFVLSQNRFTWEPFWEGEWMNGIEEVDRQNHPGLVTIRVPDSVGDTLRRGAYAFSMTVSNRYGKDTWTPLIGTMLVEYEPSSPQHDVPYRDNDDPDY